MYIKRRLHRCKHCTHTRRALLANIIISWKSHTCPIRYDNIETIESVLRLNCWYQCARIRVKMQENSQSGNAAARNIRLLFGDCTWIMWRGKTMNGLSEMSCPDHTVEGSYRPEWGKIRACSETFMCTCSITLPRSCLPLVTRLRSRCRCRRRRRRRRVNFLYTQRDTRHVYPM